MAEATTTRATPLHRGLPDEVAIWEILVRLPPKALLRCRAVCRAWRRATSTRNFLLAHHARQPTLPIASGHNYGGSHYHRNIITFDHPAADAQLQHVTRLDERFCRLDASCDGLLLLSYGTTGACFSICNPATRQYARLPMPMLSDSMVLGMYRHRPTGEYRILLYDENQEIDGHDACYIFALGSVQPPRNIGWLPEADQVCLRGGEAVLFRASMHWRLEQHEIGSNMIVVFDTTAESFRQMNATVAPVVPRYADLFEMDGVLGMFSCNDAVTIIDIWVLQD